MMAIPSDSFPFDHPSFSSSSSSVSPLPPFTIPRTPYELAALSNEEFEALGKKALAGDPVAKTELGRCYQDGILVQHDVGLMLINYASAIEKKYPPAETCMAGIFMGTFKEKLRYVIEVNEQKALDLYKRSEQSGWWVASFSLGNYYYNLSPPDYQNALLHYEKAFKLAQKDKCFNDPRSAIAYHIAIIFSEERTGVPKNNEEAKRWMMEAEKLGHSKALKALQTFVPEFPLTPNIQALLERAIGRAALLVSQEPKFNIPVKFIQTSPGVTQYELDDEKILASFKQQNSAAALAAVPNKYRPYYELLFLTPEEFQSLCNRVFQNPPDPVACMELFECFNWGFHVPQSSETALLFLKTAAIHGKMGEAINALGNAYRLGAQYIVKNVHKALLLYVQAAMQGDPNALHNIAFLYTENDAEGNPIQRNIEKALNYYQLAEKSDNNFTKEITAFNIAALFREKALKGDRAAETKKKAWQVTAAKHGCKPAQDFLLQKARAIAAQHPSVQTSQGLRGIDAPINPSFSATSSSSASSSSQSSSSQSTPMRGYVSSSIGAVPQLTTTATTTTQRPKRTRAASSAQPMQQVLGNDGAASIANHSSPSAANGHTNSLTVPTILPSFTSMTSASRIPAAASALSSSSSSILSSVSASNSTALSAVGAAAEGSSELTQVVASQPKKAKRVKE